MKVSAHSSNNMKIVFLGIPYFIAVLLILIGVFLFIRRTRLGIQTTGTVIGKAKYTRKLHKIDTDMEAPIIKYTVNGQEYTNTADKFTMIGINDDLPKGTQVRIRVNKRDHRRFVLTDSGDMAEKLFIAAGVFLIISYTVLLLRYF